MMVSDNTSRVFTGVEIGTSLVGPTWGRTVPALYLHILQNVALFLDYLAPLSVEKSTPVVCSCITKLCE